MSVTYIPYNDPSESFARSMGLMMNFTTQLAELQQRQQLLQSQLKTGNLTREAIKLENKQKELDIGYFQDTSGVRKQMLGSQAERAASEAVTAGTQSELAKKELARSDIESFKKDELHKIMMDVQRGQLLNQGLNRQEAEKRLDMMEPEFKANIERLQAQTAQAKASVAESEQQIKTGATQQAFANIFGAIKTSQDLRTTPGAYEALRSNPPDPSIAAILKAVPANLDDPNKGLESMAGNLMQMARSQGEGSAEAIDLLTLMKSKELPSDVLQQMTVDPNTGRQTVNVNQETLSKVRAGIEAWSKFQNAGIDTTPRIDKGPKLPQTKIGQQPIDAKSLPGPLRSVWSLTQKYPGAAQKRFLDEGSRKNRELQAMVSDFDREVEPGAVNDLYGGGDLSSSVSRLRLQNPREADTPFSRFKGAMTGESPEAQLPLPLVKDPAEQKMFEDSFTYDKTATSAQHLMYTQLVRELAKKRNKEEPVGDYLSNIYASLGGLDFFTPPQVQSLLAIRRNVFRE